MKQFTRVVFVALVVFSLLAGQNTDLLAQSQAPASDRGTSGRVVTLDDLVAFNTSPKTPAAPSLATSLGATPAPLPPQVPGKSSSRKWVLIAGFALAGTGAAMAIRKEPVHQTTCIAYDACPTPGLVRTTGGIMAAIGGSLVLFRLKN
jgi:hypothetical protein